MYIVVIYNKVIRFGFLFFDQSSANDSEFCHFGFGSKIKTQFCFCVILSVKYYVVEKILCCPFKIDKGARPHSTLYL